MSSALLAIRRMHAMDFSRVAYEVEWLLRRYRSMQSLRALGLKWYQRT